MSEFKPVKPIAKNKKNEKNKQSADPNIKGNTDNSRNMVKPSAFTIDERNMLVDYLKARFYPVERQIIEVRKQNKTKKSASIFNRNGLRQRRSMTGNF